MCSTRYAVPVQPRPFLVDSACARYKTCTALFIAKLTREGLDLCDVCIAGLFAKQSIPIRDSWTRGTRTLSVQIKLVFSGLSVVHIHGGGVCSAYFLILSSSSVEIDENPPGACVECTGG